MQKIPVLVAISLLLLPGCTYLDEYMGDDSSEETVESRQFWAAQTLMQRITMKTLRKTMVHANTKPEPEPEPEPVLGCTDEDAMNYDSNATQDDGSCEYMETIPCNGLVILCHRTYDQVTFPETHNSYSTHEDNIYYLQVIIELASRLNGMQVCEPSCLIRITLQPLTKVHRMYGFAMAILMRV